MNQEINASAAIDFHSLKSGPTNIHILVVDDEDGFRELLRSELTRRGYTVTTACDGEDAIEKVKKEKFQLAISDFKMPKLGGLEFLEALKKFSPETEVIIMTGFGTIETAVTAMKMGAYDFVQKPFNIEEIFALIQKILEKSELKALLGVYEMSRAIFSSIKVEELFPMAVNLALKILKADDASLYLLGPDNKLGLAAAAGPVAHQEKESRLALGERVIGKVAEQQEVVLISGYLEDDPRFAGIPHLRDIKSSIVCPLTLNGHLLGILNVNRVSETLPFNSSDVVTTTILGAQIAQAVNNAQLYNQLEEKMEEIKKSRQQLMEAQNQLIQSEKLAGIGQLAAGVAHELNNPLTGILGFAEIVLEEKTLPQQVREDVDSIYQQSKRCSQIVQNLLQFSRRKESHKEPTNVVPLLESTLHLVKYDFTTSGIDLVNLFPENPPLVMADPSQMQQVFLNMITNARQAMEKKKPGRLTIEVKTDSDKLFISFQDTGYGISKENMMKIFDPFFTTKPVGQGTGLGLSISFGIIEQHGGSIHVESEVDKGTKFIIELPILEGNPNG